MLPGVHRGAGQTSGPAGGKHVTLGRCRLAGTRAAQNGSSIWRMVSALERNIQLRGIPLGAQLGARKTLPSCPTDSASVTAARMSSRPNFSPGDVLRIPARISSTISSISWGMAGR